MLVHFTYVLSVLFSLNFLIVIIPATLFRFEQTIKCPFILTETQGPSLTESNYCLTCLVSLPSHSAVKIIFDNLNSSILWACPNHLKLNRLLLPAASTNIQHLPDPISFHGWCVSLIATSDSPRHHSVLSTVKPSTSNTRHTIDSAFTSKHNWRLTYEFWTLSSIRSYWWRENAIAWFKMWLKILDDEWTLLSF